MCCTQTSPPEESYGKDPENSLRGDAIERQVDQYHGVKQQEQDGDGAEEHHRHKRQARVDWTLRRSMVSKIRYNFQIYRSLLTTKMH